MLLLALLTLHTFYFGRSSLRYTGRHYKRLSATPEGHTEYRTAVAPLDAGAIYAGDMTAAAALTNSVGCWRKSKKP